MYIGQNPNNIIVFDVTGKVFSNNSEKTINYGNLYKSLTKQRR